MQIAKPIGQWSDNLSIWSQIKCLPRISSTSTQIHSDLSIHWVQYPRCLGLDGDYLDGIRVDMDDQIKTTVLEWGSGRERREHRRKRCLLPAQLITNAGSYDCRVLDLSKGGAKLETHAVVTPEQAVKLVVKSIGTFAGLVAWCGDGLFGMRFLAQHGTRSLSTASLRATRENMAVSDAVPLAPDGGVRGREPGISMSGDSFALHDGDVICLLRRKTNGTDPESKSLQTKPAGSESETFMEISAREFLELAEQKWARTITFMRVVPLRRRQSPE